MCEKTHMIICVQHLLFLSHLAKTGNVMTILVKLLSIKYEITLSRPYEMQTNTPSSRVYLWNSSLPTHHKLKPCSNTLTCVLVFSDFRLESCSHS
jgi:hypothetical protein